MSNKFYLFFLIDRTLLTKNKNHLKKLNQSLKLRPILFKMRWSNNNKCNKIMDKSTMMTEREKSLAHLLLRV